MCAQERKEKCGRIFRNFPLIYSLSLGSHSKKARESLSSVVLSAAACYVCMLLLGGKVLAEVKCLLWGLAQEICDENYDTNGKSL